MLLLLVCVCTIANSQTIFEGLTGDELKEALVEEYYPDQLLNFTQVKDTLYAKVELIDDSVRCVYTTHALFLPEGEDPSQAMYMNGSGINLEHVWPQSKGAGEGNPGRMDMHHLYPSRVTVNSNRANKPFGDINDNQTDRWYYKDIMLTSVPTDGKDNFSESVKTTFEPAEGKKGNIARAMFYFYTMYEDDALEAAPGFFEAQMDELCQWHIDDPVDDAEIARAERVAAYQGTTNPYVLDCTLAGRAYCGNEDQCSTVSNDQVRPDDLPVQVVQRGCSIELQLTTPESGRIKNSLVSADGKVVLTRDSSIQRGVSTLLFDACSLPNGVYVITSEFRGSASTMRNSQKLFLR